MSVYGTGCRDPAFAQEKVMSKKVPETVLSEREASQGAKLGHVRYVMLISLVLCVAVGATTYFFP
jgi:hypothetical protein